MDPRTSSTPEVLESIDALHAGISARQRALLSHVAELDKRHRWKHDGCSDMAQWLSGRLGISNWAARRWVAAAHALPHLPEISGALETGVLCLDKVLELARFATPETERKLIAWARRVSAAAIRRKADIANAPTREETAEAERERFLRWWSFDDGKRLGLEAELPAADGAQVVEAIRAVAERLADMPREERPSGSEPHDLFEQRCADALSVMAAGALRPGDDPEPASIVVHMPLRSAWDACGREGCEIERGPVIGREVARRLSCDGRLRFVLTDEEGDALGIGRASRDVPRWLRRQLLYRDRGCTFPGCGRTTYLQAHHIVHWDDGGPTDLTNLTLTCQFHHKLVHEFAWNVALVGSETHWFRPNGKRYDPGPDPPRSIRFALQSELLSA